ncbi:MAG: heparinase II/III family protein [Planctomycetota bacterium]
MLTRFDAYGYASFADSVIPDRISAARTALGAFRLTAKLNPSEYPDFYPQIRCKNERLTLEGTADATAAQLLDALNGNATAWRDAQWGLHYLLTFDPSEEWQTGGPGYALLWIAGVLCRNHPWARWWIYAGSMRASRLINGSQRFNDATPDVIHREDLLIAAATFASEFPVSDCRVPAGVVTRLGIRSLKSPFPSVADLVTEATHLNERAFAVEAGIVSDSDAERLDAMTLRDRVRSYFLERVKRFESNPLISERRKSGISDEELEGVIENRFIIRQHMERFHDFGRTIDFTSCLDGDSESRVGVNTFVQIGQLAAAWSKDRNERAGRAAVEQWRSWLEQSPAPSGWDSSQWRTLEVGNRLANSFPFSSNALIDRDDFRQFVLPDHARHVFFCLPYLLACCGPANNWTQVETIGALVALHCFPDWREFQKLKPLFENRLNWIDRRMYLDDGMQSENAPGYHLFPWQTEIIGMANVVALGGDAPIGFYERMDRAAEPLWKLRLPDGTLPAFSDASPRPIRADAFLKKYAEYRNRPDLISTLSPDGNDLPDPNTELPFAGYRVARSGWGKDAAAVAFDSGFYGSNHQHEDKLTFVYVAGGRALLCDASINRYVADAFEQYFRGAWGHSVAMIDGKQQMSILRHHRGPAETDIHPWPIPDTASGWKPGKDKTLLWGEYSDGFSTRTASLWHSVASHEADRLALNTDWVQRREIAFYGKSGIVVIDRFLSKSGDTQPHSIEQIFHLAPFLDGDDKYLGAGELKRIDSGFELLGFGQTGVRVRHGNEMDVELESWCGSTDPVRGYTAVGGEMPSHDVVFKTRVTFPATLVTILEPLAADGSPFEPETMPRIDALMQMEMDRRG